LAKKGPESSREIRPLESLGLRNALKKFDQLIVDAR